jgi:hypothetical protein
MILHLSNQWLLGKCSKNALLHIRMLHMLPVALLLLDVK